MKKKRFQKATSRIVIPPEVREYVFQRDNYQCRSCGKKQTQTALEVDHIIPIANGGSNDISNLQTLCRRCNNQKKHHFDQRFRRRFS
ncbi:HNH endonuclease [Euhalothece natronophila Z-M001]|uniref:HNH endonuclease n=1 Tax=Euhalothece natronophila Z-M001 TaxID=522448 RepID=A0A5B8NKG3_9CHRO|nr:HNH endonuclease [Euhalothece natronophila]QDZ39438.1 HNH endonuclease [Euhalothece natronophila Z-M001]